MVRYSRPTPGPRPRTWREPGPNCTVGDIVDALANRPWDCAAVRWWPSGQSVEPAELWIAGLGTWVRADGHYYLGDYGRGYVYPGWIGCWRIRRAVRKWRESQCPK